MKNDKYFLVTVLETTSDIYGDDAGENERFVKEVEQDYFPALFREEKQDRFNILSIKEKGQLILKPGEVLNVTFSSREISKEEALQLAEIRFGQFDQFTKFYYGGHEIDHTKLKASEEERVNLMEGLVENIWQKKPEIIQKEFDEMAEEMDG